jgi:deoxycytidylate deaminase
MNNHIKYLEIAKNVSLLSDYSKQKLGAILVYKKHIISVGYNTEKTHPIQAEYNRHRVFYGNNIIPKAHAETICLNRAKDLTIPYKNCILYVFRQWKNGTWAMAKPCSACTEMIRQKGIKTVVYTTYDGFAIEHFCKAT